MALHISEMTGPVVRINCPVCGALEVPSETSERIESLYVLLKHSTYWITCGKCGAKLSSTASLPELAHATAKQIQALVIPHKPLPSDLLLVLALLTCWVPYLGPTIAALAWLTNIKYAKCARASLALLLVSVGVTAVAKYKHW